MLQDLQIRAAVAISLGAIAGALSRYYLSLWFVQRFDPEFPYGTFLINVSGCFVIGFFTALASERVVMIAPEVKLLVATGFLGSYTTFSTYGLDTVILLRNANLITAILYWLGSALMGICSVQLGIVVAKSLK